MAEQKFICDISNWIKFSKGNISAGILAIVQQKS